MRSRRAWPIRLATQTGAPGPMGLANPDRVREVLTVAGWSDVTIEPSDGKCDYAIDGSDGVEEVLAISLSSTFGSAVRAALEPELDGRMAGRGGRGPRDLRAQLVDGAVPPLTGYAWLVTAKNG